jgi:sterol desaturase/sphingolipid hydroxylase (fatty acid hydroxylase superfamily)
MGLFQATVRILDVTEPDAPTAVRTVEERLHKGGFNRWQVVSLHPQDVHIPVQRLQRRAVRREVSGTGGAILLGVILALALWFLLLIAS